MRPRDAGAANGDRRRALRADRTQAVLAAVGLRPAPDGFALADLVALAVPPVLDSRTHTYAGVARGRGVTKEEALVRALATTLNREEVSTP